MKPTCVTSHPLLSVWQISQSTVVWYLLWLWEELGRVICIMGNVVSTVFGAYYVLKVRTSASAALILTIHYLISHKPPTLWKCSAESLEYPFNQKIIIRRWIMKIIISCSPTRPPFVQSPLLSFQHFYFSSLPGFLHAAFSLFPPPSPLSSCPLRPIMLFFHVSL